MKAAVDIARDHGFDVDEALVRAALADRGETQELDEDNLTEVRGGRPPNPNASDTPGTTGPSGW